MARALELDDLEGLLRAKPFYDSASHAESMKSLAREKENPDGKAWEVCWRGQTPQETPQLCIGKKKKIKRNAGAGIAGVCSHNSAAPWNYTDLARKINVFPLPPCF